MFVLAYALCAACVYRNSSDASDATILVCEEEEKEFLLHWAGAKAKMTTL